MITDKRAIDSDKVIKYQKRIITELIIFSKWE